MKDPPVRIPTLVCFPSLASDVILCWMCSFFEVRKHTAVCLSHCGPPSCTLKLAESRHRHESQSARRRAIRAIVDEFSIVFHCFPWFSCTWCAFIHFILPISDSISIPRQGIGLQLLEMHHVLYGTRILCGRMPQQSHL